MAPEMATPAHGQCNTLAVYAFKLQRIRRICVQSSEFIAKVQLTAHNDQIAREGAPRLDRRLERQSQIIRSESQLFRSSTMISAARQFKAQMKMLQTAEANEKAAAQLLTAN